MAASISGLSQPISSLPAMEIKNFNKLTQLINFIWTKICQQPQPKSNPITLNNFLSTPKSLLLRSTFADDDKDIEGTRIEGAVGFRGFVVRL